MAYQLVIERWGFKMKMKRRIITWLKTVRAVTAIHIKSRSVQLHLLKVGGTNKKIYFASGFALYLEVHGTRYVFGFKVDCRSPKVQGCISTAAVASQVDQLLYRGRGRGV
jgi:hypothetical protein